MGRARDQKNTGPTRTQACARSSGPIIANAVATHSKCAAWPGYWRRQISSAAIPIAISPPADSTVECTGSWTQRQSPAPWTSNVVSSAGSATERTTESGTQGRRADTRDA